VQCKLFAYVLILTGLVVTSACQPLERPFQPQSKVSWHAAPGPRASLYVAPPQGIAAIEGFPDEISASMAQKLQKLGIAAFTGLPVPNRYEVRVELFHKKNARYATWKIYGPDGQDTRLHTTQKLGDIVNGPHMTPPDLDPPLLQAASAIDIMLGGQGIDFTKISKPSLFVPVVRNAPGDGSETLAAAMQDAMTGYGVDVLAEQWGARYIIRGTVSMSEPVGGTQVISILWQLERQNGEFIGKVEQKNRIRAGTLSGPWGPVAIAAAQGGARGIHKLLRQVEAGHFDR
jgi:hypothetical protein